ncbi:hypothetical protein CI610_03361 [invertebrate metagenome]|uniref:Uncharacterized protein n=1 Tax=invertebrate metagenome TaxID=1711999 RepID=A0A2H9T3A7_9ZZZZ
MKSRECSDTFFCLSIQQIPVGLFCTISSGLFCMISLGRSWQLDLNYYRPYCTTVIGVLIQSDVNKSHPGIHVPSLDPEYQSPVNISSQHWLEFLLHYGIFLQLIYYEHTRKCHYNIGIYLL